MSDRPDWYNALKHNQWQADDDGVLITVSRQAVDEAIEAWDTREAAVRELVEALENYEDYYGFKDRKVEPALYRVKAILEDE